MERDLSSYPTFTRSKLIAELADVLTELTSLYRQLADSQKSEAQTKINTYALSQAQTIKDREHEAAQAAFTFTQEIYMIKSEISCEIEARDLLRMLLHAS